MAIRRSNDPRRTTTPAPAAAPPKPVAGRRPEVTVAKRTEFSPDARRAMIAESAYLRAEQRGFAPGYEEEDWLAAEKEVDALLSARPGAPQ